MTKIEPLTEEEYARAKAAAETILANPDDFPPNWQGEARGRLRWHATVEALKSSNEFLGAACEGEHRRRLKTEARVAELEAERDDQQRSLGVLDHAVTELVKERDNCREAAVELRLLVIAAVHGAMRVGTAARLLTTTAWLDKPGEGGDD